MRAKFVDSPTLSDEKTDNVFKDELFTVKKLKVHLLKQKYN